VKKPVEWNGFAEILLWDITVLRFFVARILVSGSVDGKISL
jgi:hypothetical protein